MATVKLQPFIASISGKMGDVYFKTYASGKVTMTTHTPTKRTTPVSPKEMQHRENFSRRAALVNRLKAEYPYKSKKELWELAKQIDNV